MTQCYCAIKKDDKENLETNCDDLYSSPCKELPPFLMHVNLSIALMPLLGESFHFSLYLMYVTLCSGEQMFVPDSAPMEIGSRRLGGKR